MTGRHQAEGHRPCGDSPSSRESPVGLTQPPPGVIRAEGDPIMRVLSFFVAQPERVGAVACAFLLTGVLITLASRGGGQSRGWPYLAASAAWGLCAAWEWAAREARWNIRPDA